MLADAMLDNVALKDPLEKSGDTPAARSRSPTANRQQSPGVRRACRVIGADRSSVRYQATPPDDGVLLSVGGGQIVSDNGTEYKAPIVDRREHKVHLNMRRTLS